MPAEKPKILLHVCCAPCSAHVINEVRKEFEPTIYFYDPNIHPAEEYFKRLYEVEGYVLSLGLDFIEGEYDPNRWHELLSSLASEPEGGHRCELCFRMRLTATARHAALNGFEWFGTTLSVSPHKNSRVINRVGHQIAQSFGLVFHAADFKKKDGYKKSMTIARDLDFYLQDYCGCEPSLRQEGARRHHQHDLAREERQVVSPVNDR